LTPLKSTRFFPLVDFNIVVHEVPLGVPKPVGERNVLYRFDKMGKHTDESLEKGINAKNTSVSGTCAANAEVTRKTTVKDGRTQIRKREEKNSTWEMNSQRMALLTESTH